MSELILITDPIHQTLSDLVTDPSTYLFKISDHQYAIGKKSAIGDLAIITSNRGFEVGFSEPGSDDHWGALSSIVTLIR